jgi:undecaprenyl-diphosphatase
MVTLGDANFGYFPSGHTADAMLCYGTSALILCFILPLSRRARRLTAAAAVTLALLTVFGLLWSDYHWLSDILGSVCYCGAALVVLHRFLAVRARTLPERDAPVPVATSAVTDTGDGVGGDLRADGD